MRTVAFCECDPYCQAVLRKHWPDVPVFGDIRTVTKNLMAYTFCMRELQSQGSKQDEWRRLANGGVDVICGGFPCQDISVAGKGAGIEGSRSGLWTEYARIIGEVRPRYVIVENVAALLGRGIERVLGDLAALGYDAEWHCIPASAVGAPHRRDRVWIVAYPNIEGSQRRNGASLSERASQFSTWASSSLANATSERLERTELFGSRYDLDAFIGDDGWWSIEPNMGRVAHGVPSRVDRLRALGNAIVPQIAEIIGRAIMLHEQERQ